MENEIMNNEEVMENETFETCEKGSNAISMLIGAGLTVAGFAVYKFGKKAWEKIKSRKEQDEIVVNPDKIIVSDSKTNVK